MAKRVVHSNCALQKSRSMLFPACRVGVTPTYWESKAGVLLLLSISKKSLGHPRANVGCGDGLSHATVRMSPNTWVLLALEFLGVRFSSAAWTNSLRSEDESYHFNRQC